MSITLPSVIVRVCIPVYLDSNDRYALGVGAACVLEHVENYPTDEDYSNVSALHAWATYWFHAHSHQVGLLCVSGRAGERCMQPWGHLAPAVLNAPIEDVKRIALAYIRREH